MHAKDFMSIIFLKGSWIKSKKTPKFVTKDIGHIHVNLIFKILFYVHIFQSNYSAGEKNDLFPQRQKGTYFLHSNRDEALFDYIRRARWCFGWLKARQDQVSFARRFDRWIS